MREFSREGTRIRFGESTGMGIGNEYEQQRERGNGNWYMGMEGNWTEKPIPAHLEMADCSTQWADETRNFAVRLMFAPSATGHTQWI